MTVSKSFVLLDPPALDRATMMETLEIRPMQKSDAPLLIPIEAPSFGRFHWNEEAFCNELNNQLAHYSVLLHVPTQAILAYVGVWFVAKEGHITTIATHPGLRGLGLGELLISHVYALAHLEAIECLTLEVRASNFKAQNLYYKYGFRMVGRRPRYYQDNQEDALLLTTPFMGEASQVTVVNKALAAFIGRAGGHWCKGHHLAPDVTLCPFVVEKTATSPPS